MDEMQMLAKGMSQAGFSTDGMLLVIEFPLKEPESTVLRLGLPSIQLDELIAVLTQLQTDQATAPGSSAAH